MTTPKLKPCPFCGKPPKVEDRNPTTLGRWHIYCPTVSCLTVFITHDDLSESIAAWNRRAGKGRRKK